jgi:xylulokinase
METAQLMGIDIGTQGTKGVLFDQRGRVVARATVKSRLHQPGPGIVEEDPEYQFRTVCRCIKACVTQPGGDPARVAAIGIDGQMAGVLGIGADGRHVTPYDSWLDTRCGPYITRMRRQAGERIIRATGGPASFNHGPKILWWKHERPDVFEQIARFVQPGGYAAMRLCDLAADEAFIDKSYLHFSGFADNAGGCWDESLCREFDVPVGKLPRIVDSHAVIGQVSAAAARRCGLPSGVPVIAGCGDTAASFLACGATREGICVDVAGTASVFAGTTRRFQADTMHQTLGWGQSATPGLWHPYAYINGGGMNLEWFAREWGSVAAGRTSHAMRRLDRLAARLAPDPTDPLFVPHLGGRVSPSQPLLRGSWAGVTWSHTAAHLYRAVLEGVALEYCIYRDVLRSVSPESRIREIRVTGGGERSAIWSQIKADALGIPLVHVSRQEGAPLGAALLAGYAVGLLPSLDAAARRWIRTGAAIRPVRQFRTHYATRLARYESLLTQLNHWAQTETDDQV